MYILVSSDKGSVTPEIIQELVLDQDSGVAGASSISNGLNKLFVASRLHRGIRITIIYISSHAIYP